MVILTILVLILVLAFEPSRELLFGLIAIALYLAVIIVIAGLFLIVVLVGLASA
jgi:hypothetical protein